MSEEKIVIGIDSDENLPNIMGDLAMGSSTKVSVNPLVIMNVSEHWTRINAQLGKDTQVFGALFGTKEGTNIQITNSFELKVNRSYNNITIDYDYYYTKLDQCMEVFGKLIFLGWYTTGENLIQKDIVFHNQIRLISESTIILKINPSPEVSKENRVKFYEPVFDVENEENVVFLPLSYKVIVDDIDRLILNEIFQAPIIKNSKEQSSTEICLVLIYTAARMLRGNIKLIHLYLNDVESGKFSQNVEILSGLREICQNLTALKKPIIKQRINEEIIDVGVITYLTALVKVCGDSYKFVSKLNDLYKREGKAKKHKCHLL